MNPLCDLTSLWGTHKIWCFLRELNLNTGLLFPSCCGKGHKFIRKAEATFSLVDTVLES